MQTPLRTRPFTQEEVERAFSLSTSDDFAGMALESTVSQELEDFGCPGCERLFLRSLEQFLGPIDADAVLLTLYGPVGAPDYEERVKAATFSDLALVIAAGACRTASFEPLLTSEGVSRRAGLFQGICDLAVLSGLPKFAPDSKIWTSIAADPAAFNKFWWLLAFHFPERVRPLIWPWAGWSREAGCCVRWLGILATVNGVIAFWNRDFLVPALVQLVGTIGFAILSWVILYRGNPLPKNLVTYRDLVDIIAAE